MIFLPRQITIGDGDKAGGPASAGDLTQAWRKRGQKEGARPQRGQRAEGRGQGWPHAILFCTLLLSLFSHKTKH